MALRKLVLGLMLAALPLAAGAQVVQQGGMRGGAKGDAPAPPATDTGNTEKTKSGRVDKTLDAPDPKAWFSSGMAAIRAKNPGKAVDLMKPVLADFEKRYAEEKRHIFCAVNPAQSKTYAADAAKAALAAVTIEPDWCRAQYVSGYALIDLGKIDEALVVFRHLTDLAPKNSRYLNELAYVLSDKKNYTEAVATYQRSVVAADLSPDGVDDERCIAYRGLGYNMMKLGRLDDAEKAYRACLAIDPDSKEVIDALDALADERKDTV